MSQYKTQQEFPLAYLLDDDESIYTSMSLLLSYINMKLCFFKSTEALASAIKKKPPHCLFIELNLKPIDGLSIYLSLKEKGILTPTIFLATHSNTSTAVDIMRAGAFDFIEKPFTENRLIKSCQQIIDIHQTNISR